MRAIVASVVTGLMVSIGYVGPSEAGPAQSAIQNQASQADSIVHKAFWGCGRGAGYVAAEGYAPPVYGYRRYAPRVYGEGAVAPRVYGYTERRAWRHRPHLRGEGVYGRRSRY